MRIPVSASVLFCLAVGLSFVRPQQTSASDPCKFSVHGDQTPATVTGPEDLVPLVYVVAQPDSPLEILSVDLTGMSVWTTNDGLSHKDCARYTVRNRSDKPLSRGWVQLEISAGGGSGGVVSGPLMPGQTAEIKYCGVYGTSWGGQPIEHFRLIISVESVGLDGCIYQPSLRVPRTLPLPRPNVMAEVR